MGEWIPEQNQGLDFEEEMIGELFYYSDGYIIIEDEVITGFLSNDLITGNLSENEIFIEILEDDEEVLKYSSFGSKFESVELHGKYALTRQDIEEIQELENHFAIINFIANVVELKKQKEIEEELNRVKKIYSIP